MESFLLPSGVQVECDRQSLHRLPILPTMSNHRKFTKAARLRRGGSADVGALLPRAAGYRPGDRAAMAAFDPGTMAQGFPSPRPLT